MSSIGKWYMLARTNLSTTPFNTANKAANSREHWPHVRVLPFILKSAAKKTNVPFRTRRCTQSHGACFLFVV